MTKDLDDLYPCVLQLFGEEYFEDIKIMCRHLLKEKEFVGDIEEGLYTLLQKSDYSIQYINFLRIYLQKKTNLRMIQHMSMNINFHSFTLVKIFNSEASKQFQRAKPILEVISAAFESPPIGLVCAALDTNYSEICEIITNDLGEMIYPSGEEQILLPYNRKMKSYIADPNRAGEEFWVDSGLGHNYLCALYLRFCSNKSIAVNHAWQHYLRTYGPMHLRKSTRGLRKLTTNIRKIDETAGIRGLLPHQLGYVVGLQELYSRRVGLYGPIPEEFGELKHLRVLSMGNNRLSGPIPRSLGRLTNLQRIVLHQNNLSGEVPLELSQSGCIVNLAGNPNLSHGYDGMYSFIKTL